MATEPVVLYSESDERGRPYVIEADSVDDIIERLLSYFAPVGEDEEDEYALEYCEVPWENRPPTQEERDKEVAEVHEIITQLRENPAEFLKEYHAKIPRKKNGTFAKGRLVTIWEGHSLASYWEDSYGWAGPTIYLKSVSDFRATLEFAHRIIVKR